MNLTEEEKKAIEELQSFIQKYEPYVFYSKQRGDTAEINPYIKKFDNYRTILNLIEKQQKEIVELNNKYVCEKVAKEEAEELLENSIPKEAIREILNKYAHTEIGDMKIIYFYRELKELLGE